MATLVFLHEKNIRHLDLNSKNLLVWMGWIFIFLGFSVGSLFVGNSFIVTPLLLKKSESRRILYSTTCGQSLNLLLAHRHIQNKSGWFRVICGNQSRSITWRMHNKANWNVALDVTWNVQENSSNRPIRQMWYLVVWYCHVWNWVPNYITNLQNHFFLTKPVEPGVNLIGTKLMQMSRLHSERTLSSLLKYKCWF